MNESVVFDWMNYTFRHLQACKFNIMIWLDKFVIENSYNSLILHNFNISLNEYGFWGLRNKTTTESYLNRSKILSNYQNNYEKIINKHWNSNGDAMSWVCITPLIQLRSMRDSQFARIFVCEHKSGSHSWIGITPEIPNKRNYFFIYSLRYHRSSNTC